MFGRHAPPNLCDSLYYTENDFINCITTENIKNENNLTILTLKGIIPIIELGFNGRYDFCEYEGIFFVFLRRLEVIWIRKKLKKNSLVGIDLFYWNIVSQVFSKQEVAFSSFGLFSR